MDWPNDKPIAEKQVSKTEVLHLLANAGFLADPAFRCGHDNPSHTCMKFEEGFRDVIKQIQDM